MATFPSIDPSFGITKSSSPLVTTTRFQDGYTQRIKFGLNVDPKSWAVTWENITEANADTIETFLEARVSDGDSFDWSFINLTTDGADAVTLTAGSDVTLVGRMVIMAQDAAEDAIAEGVARFRIRRTGSSAVTMYRIG